MPATCKNCHADFSGNYCNTCGQSADTDKINLRYLWRELQPILLHFEKGMLYTGKELFTRPGHK